jgi:hypothetical protein
MIYIIYIKLITAKKNICLIKYIVMNSKEKYLYLDYEK